MNGDVLQQPTLILNRNWQPLGIASVARALIKVWSDHARVVDPRNYQLYDWQQWCQLPVSDEEPVIRSTSGRLRAPQVVTLVSFDQLPRLTVAFSRRNLFERDQYTCQYCGTRPGRDDWTIDHVVPRSQGGGSSWTNCVFACRACNRRKANATPDQARMPLKQRPLRPQRRELVINPGETHEAWQPFFGNASG